MTAPDPETCRRALREIGEIAAVSQLDDSQLSEQEALQMISAIAEWVDEEGQGSADCSGVIRQLHAMTARLDFDTLDDREAVDRFGDVLAALTAWGGSAPAALSS